ncbi:AlpA family phage regulatory protein [Vibrio diazotrophicus]
MANGEFPRSIRIGARAVGWLDDSSRASAKVILGY